MLCTVPNNKTDLNIEMIALIVAKSLPRLHNRCCCRRFVFFVSCFLFHLLIGSVLRCAFNRLPFYFRIFFVVVVDFSECTLCRYLAANLRFR